MRIAVLIISLFLMLILGLQSCAIFALSSIGNKTDTLGGGALGVFVAFLFLLGAAFVLKFPFISVITFGFGGLVGLAAGATTPFTDMSMWGVASLILAGLSLVGFLGGRRRKQAPALGLRKCPYCAEAIQPEAVVCRFCGRNLQPTSGPAPTQRG
jgi:hypothetical protein